MKKLKLNQLQEIYSRGYSLDMIALLSLLQEGESLENSGPKIELLHKTLIRKGLISEEGIISLSGRELLEFPGEEKLEYKSKVRATPSDFDRWWKAYPGTDTFTFKGRTFSGTRSLRVKKDDCRSKINKILEEGEYTIDNLIEALKYEVEQKKENSLKTNTNKLTFMQNSLTYLNQRTFEPFIELIQEGIPISEQISGGTDI